MSDRESVEGGQYIKQSEQEKMLAVLLYSVYSYRETTAADVRIPQDMMYVR